MRKVLMFSTLIAFILCGCGKAKKEPSQTGIYKMNKLTVSIGGKDSVYVRAQMKIYTDKYFAYASLAPDSSVGFGVGSWTADTGKSITENGIYSSLALDSPKIFHLLINRKDSTYTQIIPMTTAKGVKYNLKEEYTQLPTSDTSKMDGVWKLDKAYIVKGRDTTKQKEVQYKTYWGGHFMFIHRYPLDNAATKFKNGFGYGDFSLKNDTLSETEQLTSHATLMGRSFAIKITFNGADEYSQVITDKGTGEQSVEVYRRLK
ncbi:MAG TPA: hypothetical protein VHS53_18305 [Mucilaginibacter sp.]|jgi:hypothetical protein|nr:hypothetical protein [Mucilaginibacter sp.]